MDFEATFRSTMTETVTLEAPAGTDKYGEPDFTGVTAKTYAAWISRKPREVRTARSEVRVSSAAVWLGGRVESDGSVTPLRSLPDPTPEWRLTLPDGSKPQILNVRLLVDPQGDKHEVLDV